MINKDIVKITVTLLFKLTLIRLNKEVIIYIKN